MSFAGAVQAMITSLKNNARSRKSGEFFKQNRADHGQKKPTMLHFPEANPQEKARFQTQFHAKRKRQSIARLILSASVALGVIYLLYVLGFFSA